MKLTDSFKLSINSILHRKLRAWLTLLGIIIGVAALVAIVSIGEGAQASVNARLAGFGADILTISPGFSRAGGFGGDFRPPEGGAGGGRNNQSSSTSTTKTPELTRKDVSLIQGNPNVIAVNEVVSGRAPLIFLSERVNTSIQGINPNTWKTMTTMTVASGRFLTPSDTTGIVIGNSLATRSVFKQPITLGRTVTINGKPFTVVGILAASGGGGFGDGGGDNSIYMNYQSAWDITDVNRDTFSSLQVKIADPSLATETVTGLTQTLQISRKVTDRTQDFSITNPQTIQQQISSVTQTLTLFLGAIAAVSLIVGAIGVANSMFTSVLEKTKEIGTLKALGATNVEVLRLFIIESALFGLTGGIIGVVLGTLVSIGISSIGLRLAGLGGAGGPGGGLTTAVPLDLAVVAIVLSTVIGVIAGIIPACSAANLKPIEALRYE